MIFQSLTSSEGAQSSCLPLHKWDPPPQLPAMAGCATKALGNEVVNNVVQNNFPLFWVFNEL